MILQTTHCILRELTPSDAENMYRLNLDPDVLQYTGDTAFPNIESAHQFLSQYDHYSKYGFGRWAVTSKQNNQFLGWCGIKYTPELDEHDIGFRFFKSEWDKGIATETALACIQYGFDTLNLSSIVGRAMKENHASIRVLQKCGMVFWKNIDFAGDEEGVVYIIQK